jgi:hypothetical protein
VAVSAVYGESGGGQITIRKTWVPAMQVLEFRETEPSLNEAGEITTSIPPTKTEIAVLKSQGIEIQISEYAASDQRHWTTYWRSDHHHTPVLVGRQYWARLGSPMIRLLPVSKIVLVIPTTRSPFTVILCEGTRQKPGR